MSVAAVFQATPQAPPKHPWSDNDHCCYLKPVSANKMAIVMRKGAVAASGGEGMGVGGWWLALGGCWWRERIWYLPEVGEEKNAGVRCQAACRAVYATSGELA